MPETRLRTGELARAAGVNIQTLRYYHRCGLLDEPERSLGGHRLYPAEAVTTVRVIRAAQRLGFTLAEIAELVRVTSHRHGARHGGRLRASAVAKVTELDRRIADLQAIRNELVAALDAADAGSGECSCGPECPLPLAELARA